MRSASAELKLASCSRIFSDRVADSANGLYQLMIVFAIDLASQQPNEGIEGVLLHIVVKLPNSLDDGVSGNYSPCSPHQQFQ